MSAPSKSSPGSWTQIDPAEVELSAVTLGGGSFAAVFRGSYRGRGVAVKVAVVPTVGDDQLSDFSNELMVLARVQHPSVVALVGACMKPPKPMLVMELCRGSLYDAIHGKRAASFSTTAPARVRLAMAIDCGTSIAHLHGLSPSVVHRDVKTQNYLFAARPGRGESLVLADFGLVGHRAADAGTPAYLAPELWLGKPFGRPVDVYAFGIVLYELFSGSLPWPGLAAADIRAAVLRGERPQVGVGCCLGISAAVQAIVNDCLLADPATRPTIVDSLARLREAAEIGDARPGGSVGATGAADADVLGAAMSKHASAGLAGKGK